MRRRDFIKSVGVAVATWPLAARANDPIPVIGLLSGATEQEDAFRIDAFRQGLGDVGFAEGRDVAIVYRGASGHYDQLPDLALELVRAQVTVIASLGPTLAALAAKHASTTIPIVFYIGADPVKVGLVASLNRPDANVTGVSTMFNIVVAKQFELLRQAVPNRGLIGFLANPTNSNAKSDTADAQAAARALDQTLILAQASTDGDLDAEFARLDEQHVGAILLAADVFFRGRTDRLAALALQHRLPMLTPWREGTWPLAARGQQAIPVIGYLSAQSFNAAFPARQAAFVRGLKETGYIERENVTIEYVSAEGRYELLPAMARQLVSRKVDLIASTGGAPASLAAKDATSTIPIVIVTGDDAVKSGLVASLNRPGGNVTGVSFLTSALGAKRLGLLQDLVPTTKSFALLINPTSPEAGPYTTDVEAAARAIGKPLQHLNASTEAEISAAFAALAGQRDLVLMVGADAYFTSRRDQIVTLAARDSIPAIYANRDIVEAGGLMSYGPDLTEQYRQAGVHAGRILKGEKPATMPVLQPTKFEFVINLKTARALGLTVPSGIMAIADEVIE